METQNEDDIKMKVGISQQPLVRSLLNLEPRLSQPSQCYSKRKTTSQGRKLKIK
jgi:hypothetical protein